MLNINLKMNKKNIPNYITIFRILLTLPILILLAIGTTWSYWGAGSLWLIAGLTDMIDGHLSRKWKAQTIAGAFLDPMADKILTLSTLIWLCYQQEVFPILVIILTVRDIYVTSLRALAAEKQIILYAKPLAKWKTALEIIGILCLIMSTPLSAYLNIFGAILLWICVVLSIITAFHYTTDFKNKCLS